MVKKVLIASDEIYPYGWGIGKYAILLHEELTNQGHTCKILGTYKHNTRKIYSYSSDLGFQNKINLFKKFILTIIYCVKFKPQIILCVHSSSVLIFYYLSIIGFLNRTKKVIVFHGSDVEKIRNEITRKSLNKYFNIFFQQYCI